MTTFAGYLAESRIRIPLAVGLADISTHAVLAGEITIYARVDVARGIAVLPKIDFEVRQTGYAYVRVRNLGGVPFYLEPDCRGIPWGDCIVPCVIDNTNCGGHIEEYGLP